MQHTITRYAQAAMAHARIERLPDSCEFYGPIPGFPGVWATGTTADAGRAELHDVLEEWIALGLSQHHRLPAVDGIEITIQAVG